MGWRYPLFPCVLGSAVLYAIALALAPLRLQCRLQANVKQLQGAFVDREKMRQIFYQAGDCRDGERCLIDVDELRGLLDRSFGAEVDEEDCEAMLWAADADYDGRVSFEEFMELINRGVVGRMVEDALEQTAKSKSR
eukprot:Transcript_10916.p4 GENE.Transcript_10916~~Transcript_10916.p4  ORF type:complete len:137 (-),score=61.79 Transcript_10916:881-1291(-)